MPAASSPCRSDQHRIALRIVVGVTATHVTHAQVITLGFAGFAFAIAETMNVRSIEHLIRAFVWPFVTRTGVFLGAIELVFSHPLNRAFRSPVDQDIDEI